MIGLRELVRILNYTAVVCKLYNVRKHPNADRLQLAEASGYTVIVGSDNYEGQLGIYFPCDGALSQAYADANNLVGYNDPVTGEHAGGFFAKNRRVRALKLRGEKSDGYWTTLDTLHFINGVSEATGLMKEGDQFDAINNVKICEKYFTPATLRGMKNNIQKKNHVNTFFAKHVETGHFLREDRNIPDGSIIYITEKLHGTSGRFGHILDEKEIPHPLLFRWIEKIFKFFGSDRRLRKDIYEDFDHLLGTRNIVMDKYLGQSYYGDEEFRRTSVRNLEGRLFKGEILYFELVGWTNTGAPIMPPADISVLKDKELQKKYPKQMFYSYGCSSPISSDMRPRYDLYVYRITRVTDDGNVTELSWPQVKARCEQLGIKTVPELTLPYFWEEGRLTNWCIDAEKAITIVEELSEGPSTVDPRHIKEGICLRIETPDGRIYWLKHKNYTFKVLEGHIKENDQYIDLEEVS